MYLQTGLGAFPAFLPGLYQFYGLAKLFTVLTVFTYVSAIGHTLRVAEFTDPSDSHFIRVALRGYAKMNPGARRLIAHQFTHR